MQFRARRPEKTPWVNQHRAIFHPEIIARSFTADEGAFRFTGQQSCADVGTYEVSSTSSRVLMYWVVAPVLSKKAWAAGL